jgi:hypothetical protein
MDRELGTSMYSWAPHDLPAVFLTSLRRAPHLLADDHLVAHCLGMQRSLVVAVAGLGECDADDPAANSIELFHPLASSRLTHVSPRSAKQRLTCRLAHTQSFQSQTDVLCHPTFRLHQLACVVRQKAALFHVLRFRRPSYFSCAHVSLVVGRQTRTDAAPAGDRCGVRGFPWPRACRVGGEKTT